MSRRAYQEQHSVRRVIEQRSGEFGIERPTHPDVRLLYQSIEALN